VARQRGGAPTLGDAVERSVADSVHGSFGTALMTARLVVIAQMPEEPRQMAGAADGRHSRK
jgi:hypothetical protein